MPDEQNEPDQVAHAVADDRDAVGAAAVESDALAVETRRPCLVVVLGMHRSGTSLCAHVLNALGVAMSDDPDPVASNPKGQWERLEIVRLHDRVLDLFGRGYYTTPLHDLALPRGWWSDPRLAPIRRDLVALLKPRLLPGVPIGFKDPRTCRLLRLWQDIFTELDVAVKFVLCVRHPAQVARSLSRRDGLPHDTGEYRWFSYMAEIFDQLRGQEICTVEYERWFADAMGNATKLARFLGLAAGKSPADITAAISPIVDGQLSHDDPALTEPNLTMAASLYGAVRRIDTDPAVRVEIIRIVDEFRAFQQLYQPIERELEALTQSVLKLPQLARDDDTAPVVSWLDPRVSAALNKVAGAAQVAEASGSTEPLMAKVNALLQQRSELDAALAKAQQLAAQRERDARVAEREVTALRRLLDALGAGDAKGGADDAAPGEDAARAPVVLQTPVPAGKALLPPAVLPELIQVVIERNDAELVDRMIQLHGDDPEFCHALAVSLFEAGFSDQARRAAAKVTRAFAKPPPDGSVTALPDTPIFFRYEPIAHRSEGLVLWYRPAYPVERASNRVVAARVRWFDATGRVLIWESPAAGLDLSDDRLWQPLRVELALWPLGTPWLRFEVLAATDGKRIPLCAGFIISDWRASDGTVRPDGQGDVLAFTHPRKAVALPGAVPWGIRSLSEAGGDGSRSQATGAAPQQRGPILLQTEALEGAEILFLVDWACFGKRLAVAQLPAPSLGADRLLLPGADPAAQIFGYARARGIFLLAVAAGHSGRQTAPSAKR